MKKTSAKDSRVSSKKSNKKMKTAATAKKKKPEIAVKKPKAAKKIVPVNFNEAGPDAEVEPLDKSAQSAYEATKKQKTNAEVANAKIVKKEKRGRGKGIKMQTGPETVYVDSPPSQEVGRNVATATEVGPPKPFVGRAIDTVLGDLKKETDLEMLEYE